MRTRRKATVRQKKLARDNVKLAFFLARKYHALSNREPPIEDMESEALLTLLYSAICWKPDFGVPFGPYAARSIARNLSRWATSWREEHYATRTFHIERERGTYERACSEERLDAQLDAKDALKKIERILDPYAYNVLRRYHMEGESFVQLAGEVGKTRACLQLVAKRARERVRIYCPELEGAV